MQLETRKRQGNSLWQKQVYAGMRTNAYGTRQAIGAERMIIHCFSDDRT